MEPDVNTEIHSPLRRELNRLATFSEWPGIDSVSSLTLAKSGFYYNRVSKDVVCWRCNNRLSANDGEVNIRQSHRLQFPDCPEMNSRTSANIALQLPDLNIQPRATTETDSFRVGPVPISELSDIVCQRAMKHGVFDEKVIRLSLFNPNFDLLRREALRLETFRNWPPSNNVNPNDLARAGFFYAGTEDRVRCAFCRKYRRDWGIGNDPLVEHRRSFPDCPFARGDLAICANVPADSDLVEGPVMLSEVLQVDTDLVAASPYSHDGGAAAETVKSSQSSVVRKPSLQFECAVIPKHPEMSSETVRRTSFLKPGVQLPKGQKIEDLAAAGFFYVGPGDYCKCFFCGGGLKQWQENDDPKSEHAKWYPRCGFVKGKWGQEFISSSQNAKGDHLRLLLPTLSESPPKTLRKDEFDGQRVPFTSLQASSSNYPPDTVSRTSIATDSTSKDKSKNKKRKKKKASNVNKAGAQQETATAAAEEEPAEETVNSYDPDSEEYLLEENRRLREARTCKVCREREVKIVFLPCGHLICCQECAPDMPKCPACRVLIRGTVSTFFNK